MQPILISRETNHFNSRKPFRRIGSRITQRRQLSHSHQNPSPYNVKFFAASELLEQVQDRAWLAKVTNALNQHWQKRYAAKQSCSGNGSLNGHVVSVGQSSAVNA